MSFSVPNVTKQFINNQFQNLETWQIVSLTATTTLTLVWLWDFYSQNESLRSKINRVVFKLVRKVPYVSSKINSELETASKKFKNSVKERFKTLPNFNNLEDNGMDEQIILEHVNEYLNIGDYDWKKGFVSGAVYYDSKELKELITKVYGATAYTNPLHADIFPGICKMEAEVVRITANLFNGGPNTCGTMTTGGTESIFMACKAYRDFARAEKGIKNPLIIAPRTAHPAFEKAAKYLNVSIHYVPVNPDATVDSRIMESAINKNTVMLVGSVPNYPYGTMDDIEQIAALGIKYNIPVHVDCCLGGFLLPFLPMVEGETIKPFDFRVPGVTSISADTHKYAYAPKGSSVIMYSDLKYLHHQYCITTDWPGGMYGSPTVNGSRAGGNIAVCWATMMYFGREGYIQATKKIIKTSRDLEKSLRTLSLIEVIGKPVTSVIAIKSDVFDIFRLVEFLNNKGWSVNPLQFPPGLHICITELHTRDGVADRFLSDIRNGLFEILLHPDVKVEGKMAMYGMSQGISDRTIVGDLVNLYIDSNYYTPTSDEEEI